MSFKQVETLIVGGSFSSIPLQRELDKTGSTYVVINAGKRIWDDLEKNDRLDFDLVSSLYTSVYTFELVDMMRKNKEIGDRYPTAKEFFAIMQKYQKLYAHKTIKGQVEKIENYSSHSIVTLDDGTIYKANNVVLSTSFKRQIHKSLEQFKFDEALKGKTVALQTIGDSSNLIIAKLVCFGAKVKLISNGFVALDKIFKNPEFLSGSKTSTLDQFEYHNISRFFPTTYDGTISSGYLQSYMFPNKLIDFLYGPLSFNNTHPLAVREDSSKRLRRLFRNIYLRVIPFVPTARFPDNSNIAIKHWPIDIYEDYFSDNLEAAIDKGFLLNDLPFFIDQGYVELYPKKSTIINKSTNTFVSNNESVAYDYLIEGDRETPNLPEIVYHDDKGAPQPFNYKYRNTYMGVLAPELNNIFLLGYTRPFTGGLSNITEMQCLLVHKMIVNTTFNAKVRHNITKKIKHYNKTHYLTKTAVPSDHVVYFGFYTEEMARIIGIQPRLRDCRSLKAVAQYFLFPNNSHYYRQKGEYAVDGASDLVNHVSQEHQHFLTLLFPLTLYWFFISSFLMSIYYLPIPKLYAVLACVGLLMPIHLISGLVIGNWGIPNANRPDQYGFLVHLMLLVGLITAPIYSAWYMAFIPLVASFVFIKTLSKKGMNRHVFCDLKSKRRPEYKTFFKHYKTAFLNVMRAKTSKRAKQTTENVLEKVV
jgi:hypothetical protein